MITKKALQINNCLRTWELTGSAREAWSLIIEIYKKNNPNGVILLPAYIGWSPNEGSGIFDSVRNSKMPYDFYPLDGQLQIEFDALKNKIEEYENVLVLLVHYFGFYDSKYEKISEYLLKNDIFFVEDCAHAWMTDLMTGKCGRKGKYSFYSLHKLLPIEKGGMLVDNYPEKKKQNNVNPFTEFSFDIFSIYKKRKENYNYLLQKIHGINGIKILYNNLENICPQTLPVLLENFDRNLLYTKMNDKGFGMVSLYHTMIEELKSDKYKSTLDVSNRIINFPVHQDIELKDLDEMITALKEVLYA